jgi:hypothetical protein
MQAVHVSSVPAVHTELSIPDSVAGKLLQFAAAPMIMPLGHATLLVCGR